jgi:His/Glu/Gln/Arg/opine family amino acid ABC transporter permease subunit
MTFDFAVIWNNKHLLAHGLSMTLLIWAVSMAISIVIGLILALMRDSGNVFLKPVSIGIIEVIRNTPFLIQIFLVFYALPFFGIRLGNLTTAIGCLSIYGGAYLAEVFRGGIQAVPKGQSEAGQALGLRYLLIIRKIILPQLMGYVIPPGTNILVTMLKESSVLSIITVSELTYMAHDINGRTFSPVETFVTIAFLYWVLSTALLTLMNWVQQKTTSFERLESRGVGLRI